MTNLSIGRQESQSDLAAQNFDEAGGYPLGKGHVMTPDELNETGSETARRILRELLPNLGSGVLVSRVRETAEANGVSLSAVQRARHEAGIVFVHNGPRPGYWERPTKEDD
jgi:hypothetical protein